MVKASFKMQTVNCRPRQFNIDVGGEAPAFTGIVNVDKPEQPSAKHGHDIRSRRSLSRSHDTAQTQVASVIEPIYSSKHDGR